MDPRLTPFEARPHGVLIRGVRGGEGPPALLLHGTAGSWRNFRPWLPALLPRLHLVLPDLPGFGTSPAPPLRPRLRTWARLLHALMAELGLAPRVLGGLGLGASIALAYLQVRQEALAATERLVLYAPAYYPGAIRPAFRWGVRVLGAPLVFPLVRHLFEHPEFQRWYLEHVVQGPDAPEEDVRLLREDFQRASLPTLRGLARDVVRADFRPLLAACQAATLALVAEEDPFVYHTEVRRLERLMPRVTVVVQPDLGHGWTAAAIEEQNAHLGRFLDQPP